MSNSAAFNNDSKQEVVLEREPDQLVSGSDGVAEHTVSLLDELIGSSLAGQSKREAAEQSARARNRVSLADFLATGDVATKLQMWLGEQAIEKLAGQPWSKIARQLQRDIAKIDELLNRQVNAILHHESFQRLESRWRGVDYLTRCHEKAGDAPIKIRILNASWSELCKDFDRSIEFDQSQLFRKVYEEEIGTPGGIPFSTLIADYDIHPRPNAEHPYDDIAMLKSLSAVAAAAFCPIILNAAPAMFSMQNFEEMQSTIDYSKVQQDLSFLSWRQFRETEDARFVGLAMPRMLMRQPYRDWSDRRDGFPFTESIEQLDDQLWGGACFAIGETLMRCFAESRWLASIRGVQRGKEGGGVVLGAALEHFATDSKGIREKSLTDLMVSDALEVQMVELGFMPLCNCKDSSQAAFYACPSTQKPRVYQDLSATTNAKMSSMLNYMFCVSRFAHYVKVIGREAVGSFAEPEDLQFRLQDWLHQYITSDSEASDQTKSRYPLRDGEVKVYQIPGAAGHYGCTIRLSPHYELEDMQASIQLRAELNRPK